MEMEGEEKKVGGNESAAFAHGIFYLVFAVASPLW